MYIRRNYHLDAERFGLAHEHSVHELLRLELVDLQFNKEPILKRILVLRHQGAQLADASQSSQHAEL